METILLSMLAIAARRIALEAPFYSDIGLAARMTYGGIQRALMLNGKEYSFSETMEDGKPYVWVSSHRGSCLEVWDHRLTGYGNGLLIREIWVRIPVVPRIIPSVKNLKTRI